jgi:hypothetical protein
MVLTAGGASERETQFCALCIGEASGMDCLERDRNTYTPGTSDTGEIITVV